MTYFYKKSDVPQNLHSFPTRRSSDLAAHRPGSPPAPRPTWPPAHSRCSHPSGPDRKSTRLNSSHVAISYAVCCLKKQKEHCVHHVTLCVEPLTGSRNRASTVRRDSP